MFADWDIPLIGHNQISPTPKPLRSQVYCGCYLEVAVGRVMIFCAVLSAPVLQPCDVFEQPPAAGPRKIEFHISVPEATAIEDRGGPGQEVQSDECRGKTCHSLL